LEAYARSDAKSSRRASGRPESPAGRVADWGGKSTGSRKKVVESTAVVHGEGNKGVVRRGLSGDGVQGMERKGGALGSLRSATGTCHR
jgi:hypothetical protein